MGGASIILQPVWGALPLLAILPWICWRERHDRRRLVVRAALAVYLATLFGLTLFPLPLPPYDVPPGLPVDPNLEPFRTISRAFEYGPLLSYQPVRLVVGNVAAFVPLGLLLPLLAPRARSWFVVLAVGVALSLAIELTQLAVSLAIGFPFRHTDVDDVLLNATGALAGYSVLVALSRFGIDTSRA